MPRSNEPDGEDKREDRGHGLRPEAKWVVLLGVLASAATVLTFVVVMGPTLLHFIVPVPTPSPSPSPTPTQSTLHVQKSPVSTPPSPTSDPASPPVVPSDFDEVATDPTQVGVATMLPQQYHDSGTAFDRTSGWVPLCPTGNATAGVRGTLSHYGCTSEVVGT